MLGTGMVPGPFARADFRGLDDVLAALERAEEEWGEHFEPPLILRRLVAQGRLGAKAGQGFYPYPQVESGYETAPVKLDMRGDVAVRVARQPAGELARPGRHRRARARPGTTSWRAARGRWCSPRRTRRCSAPAPTSRRSPRGISSPGREHLEQIHALGREWERSPVDDDRRGQRHGAGRRLRDRDGLRRPAGGPVGLLRPAGGQPRDHPGLRRHAAARRGWSGRRRRWR